MADRDELNSLVRGALWRTRTGRYVNHDDLVIALDAVLPLIEADLTKRWGDRVEALSDEFVRMSNEGTTLLTLTEANRLVCSLLTKDEWLVRGATADTEGSDKP